MSSTVHERSAEMLLDQMMADPDGPETLRLAHRGIREKRWGADYIDALGQWPQHFGQP